MKYGDIINLLEMIISEIEKKPDQTSKFRIDSYRRVIDKIMPLGANKSVSKAEIKKLNLTNYMYGKICDLIDHATNKINKSDTPDKSDTHTPDIYNTLIQIMGIGPKKAQELIKLGFAKNKNINADKIAQELKKAKWQSMLHEETKAFLAARPKTPIDRGEIRVIEKEIKKLKWPAQIVGSYRRNKPKSNDIDILVRVDGKNTLHKFVELLPGKKYIYSSGADKIAIIYTPKSTNIKLTNIKNENVAYEQVAYKIDIFGAEADEFTPMLLYSTGSKEFNIEMRRRAKLKGYLLNQRGMFDRATGKKIKGLKTEASYFKFLEMKYLPPEAR